MYCVICDKEKRDEEEYIKGLQVCKECYEKAMRAKEKSFMKGMEMTLA